MQPQIKSRAVSYPDVMETAGVYTFRGLMMSFWIGFGSSLAASYAWELVRPSTFGCVANTYRSKTMLGVTTGNIKKDEEPAAEPVPFTFNFPL